MFDGSQKEIGRGMQAIVYYYKGFAYKVYQKEYPKEWIHFEVQIQNEINKTQLPVVKYYETEDLHVTKMDFLDGVTMADRLQKGKYKSGVEDLLALQKKVNAITDVKVPMFKPFATREINQMQFEQGAKDKALKYLEEIEERYNLIHLDFHFSNIMFVHDKYYIIDWINTRLGNPIFDYARSYVLMNEFAYRQGQKYHSLIQKDKEVDTSKLDKAVYVMALLRLKEQMSERTLSLLNETG